MAEFPNIYQELTVFILGALPVSEVRGAIPAAIFAYQFPIWKAFILAVAGNVSAGLIVLMVLKYLTGFISSKSIVGNKLLTWVFERTERAHAEHFRKHKYAALALFIFVAIPLPLTGAWSGAVASIIFNIPLRLAAVAISTGVITAGLITAILSHAGLLAAQSII